MLYTGAVGLACLKIRSRNKEAINSTQKRIYSLKDFYFHFIDIDTFLNICFWIDLVRVLVTTGNMCAVADYTRV